MQRRISLSYSFLIIGVIILTLISCDVTQSEGTGDLTIILKSRSTGNALTWLSSIDMEITSYTISGSGPTSDDSFIEEGFTEDVFEKSDLAVGSWSIVIDGYNDGGTKIGTDTISIIIRKSKETSETATIEPLVGTGTLTVNVSWTDTLPKLTDPQVWVTIRDKDGEDIENISDPVKLTNTLQTATKTIEDLPTEWYEATVGLYEGISEDVKELVWQGVFAFRIVKDETTTGNVIIPEDQIVFGTGRILLTIEEEMKDPFSVSFSVSPEVVTARTGVPFTYSANEEYPEGTQFRWYVDGIKQVGSSESFTHTFSGNGVHTVSLLVLKDGVLIGDGKSVEVEEGIKAITGGLDHTIILKNNGTVWATGYNAGGQLGLGDTADRDTFIQVAITDVKAIAAGNLHTIILKEDGTVWMAGDNWDGPLGLEDFGVNTFTEVDITGVDAIAAGDLHSIILKEDGTVWVAGSNEVGQLGLGDTTKRTTFTQVLDISLNPITGVKAVAGGGSHSIILKEDGTVWVAGSNEDGQLGLGDTTNKNIFTEVDITGVDAIAAGYLHSIILKEDGTVWVAGSNEDGQLGLGDTTNRNIFTEVDTTGVGAIAGGGSHSIILKEDGTVWVAGSNEDGQLGLGDTTNRNTFIEVDITGVGAIAGGGYHSIILKEDMPLWVAGCNESGQLGLDSTDNKNIFTEVLY